MKYYLSFETQWNGTENPRQTPEIYKYVEITEHTLEQPLSESRNQKGN